ncbi:MAG: hypothetical protein Cons2KO_26840 [Congregibacter sp.]
MSDLEHEGERQLDTKDDERSNSETILMALDQISQTIDVMNSVVGRLRHFVEENVAQGVDSRSSRTVESVLESELTEETEARDARGDRILH